MNNEQPTIEYVEYRILEFLVRRKRQVTLRQIVANVSGYKERDIKSYLVTLGMKDMIKVIAGDGDVKYVLALAGFVAWDDYPRNTQKQEDARVSENEAREASKEGITEVLTTLNDLTIGTTKFNMSLYGKLTIAEVVEAIESASKVTVTKADLVGDIVTLTITPHVQGDDVQEFEECYECGGTCDYHEEWCPYNYA